MVKRLATLLWLLIAGLSVVSIVHAQPTAQPSAAPTTPTPAPPIATPPATAAPATGTPPPTPPPAPLPTPPTLSLRVGFGSAVSSVTANGIPSAPAIPGFDCGKGGTLLIPGVQDSNGNPFCIVATVQGLNVSFKAALPFVTPMSLTCTALNGGAGAATSNLISFVARVGYRNGQQTVYNGARAECEMGPGFAYVLSVETQNASGIVPAYEAVTRTLVIPWSLLHLGRHAISLLINLDVCGNNTTCSANLTQFVVPLHVVEGSESLSVANAPYVRLQTPTPRPSSTPFRVHKIEADGSLNWDRHDIVSVAFSQDQSYVAGQRALSQALSLAPLSLPQSGPTITVTQTLQMQSSSLFGFQMPSDLLEDPSLKPLFDVLPFSVTRVGSLSSGYAYGYSSDDVKGGLFYGSQARGWYSGGGTITLALPTPTPTPEPSPTPTPVTISKTGAVAFLPLRPPPPPAPFFESGTASVPPAEVTWLSAFTGSKGNRDGVNALAVEGHVYENQSTTADNYDAETVNIFGRLERDFQYPTQLPDSSLSQFIGESSTFTTATLPSSSHPSYFQIRETVGQQENDINFAPPSGTVTWLAPLSGPVAHVTASYAAGTEARFFSLDLIGFRLTNTNHDIAAQEGWQVSIPLPNFFDTPGWLLSGGSETQTVSDRMAALEQGVIPGYSTAFNEVVPTPGPHVPVPEPSIRPERLGNASLLSPWLGENGHFQAEFVSGYDFGTVTGCGQLPPKKHVHTPRYQCLTEMDNRGVGGLFLRDGLFGIGATDTSTMQGNATAGSAARNLGTSGALPGTVTSYITYSGCPAISTAYTNAAFPTGIPLPQQGITLSSELDYPVIFGATQLDLGLGYFNEKDTTNPTFNEAGFFGVVRITTPFQGVRSPCAKL